MGVWFSQVYLSVIHSWAVSPKYIFPHLGLLSQVLLSQQWKANRHGNMRKRRCVVKDDRESYSKLLYILGTTICCLQEWVWTADQEPNLSFKVLPMNLNFDAWAEHFTFRRYNGRKHLKNLPLETHSYQLDGNHCLFQVY